MVEIDKKPKVDYYNGNQILGYSDRPFKFVVGNRSAGKSFFWKSYCIKKFLKSKHEFIYIRRFKNDFEDTLTTFFDDVKFKFPDVDFAVKKNKFYINGEYAGFAESISRVLKIKSSAYPNVMTIFFDEFLHEDGRYVKNEFSKVQSLYSTIARGEGKVIRDDVNFIFVANHVSFYNPYFKAMKVRITPDSKYIKGPNAIIEVFKNEGVTNEIINSKAGSFLSLGEYGESLMEGNFILDNNTFIRPLEKNARYRFTIKHDGIEYGIYKGNEAYYVSSKVDPNCKSKYVFSNEDHELNYIFIESWRKASIFPQLKLYYENGGLFFTNSQCKKMFLEVMNYIT